MLSVTKLDVVGKPELYKTEQNHSSLSLICYLYSSPVVGVDHFMNDSNYILFFLGILGAFNGIILGIYLLFLTRKKSIPNYFLGCLLLALSIRIGKSVFVHFNPGLAKIYLQIGLSGCFLIGPMLYYFVKSTIEQPSQLPKKWKVHIGILLGIILLGGILFPYASNIPLWNKYIIRGIYLVWLLYIIVSIITAKHLFAKLFNKNAAVRNSLKVPEKWLLTIVGANVVIALSFFLAAVLPRPCNIYFSGSLIFSFILYAVIIVLLKRKKPDEVLYPAQARNPSKKVNDDNAAAVLGKLEQVMAEQEIYKNPNLTLSELAKAVNISGHQLSQLLNDKVGKNFTSYINEYRINKACAMIAANHPFSLEAIGYEVGFNSKSTFYTAFRKLKATTPSLYKESLEKTGSL